MMNRKKIEQLLISILFPLAAGMIAGLISSGASMDYQQLIRPPLSPPAVVFPIVWTILYLLMGISAYLIGNTESAESQKAMKLYFIQLGVNFLWSIFFFNFQWYLFSFVWLIILIILIVMTIKSFYKINKTAAYLMVPYLIWSLFAAYLNFMIYYLNR